MAVDGIAGLVAVVIALAVMLSAAVHDVRTREVPDAHWRVMAIAGPFLYFVYCAGDGFEWTQMINLVGMLCAGCAFVFGSFRQDVVLASASVICVAAVALFGDLTPDDVGGVMSQIMAFAYFGLYEAGLIRGGADAKCLITLGMMLPVYYDIGGAPLITRGGLLPEVFVPSLGILYVGAIIAAVWALSWSYSARGIVGHDRLTPVMGIDDAEKSFVWPAVGRRLADDDDIKSVYAGLRGAGVERVPVTYMIPFIAPLAIAAAFVAAVGNPLFLI